MTDHDRWALDDIAADATPGSVEADVGGWRCKASPEVPFRRANVVRPPLGAGRDPAAVRRALGEVGAWCAARDRRLIVQVSSADPDAALLDAQLAEAGLTVEAPVHVMVAAVPTLLTPAPPGGLKVEVRVGVDEAWAAGIAVDGTTEAQQARAAGYGRLLAPRGDRALAAISTDPDGTVVGVGFAVLDRGWVGIFGMVTAPAHRRRGVASSLVRALGAEASERRAQHAYLQVETDNAPAIACYERLGFAISHGYHYRADRPDPDQGC